MKAVLFDFSDVVGRMRMAFQGEAGEGPYRIELIPEVAQAVVDLRDAGMKTALVTNNDREAFEHHAPHIHLEELFDVVVFSSDVGVAKPRFKIFVHTLEQLGIEAQDAMFIDDLPRNVDAAEALGMQGVVADSVETVLNAVQQLLETR